MVAFPGQGSLTPGAGAPWASHDAFDVVREVGSRTGVDLEALLTTGDAEALVDTQNAQLGTYALSLCVLEATGIADRADVAIGHSLGEYTALVARGVLPLGAAADLVAARGAAMREAAALTPGGLVALLGADEALATSVCEKVGGLWLANLNGPGQVVVGGADAALRALEADAKALGVRRCVRLRVAGAFHTPLMAAALERLAPALAAAPFDLSRGGVVANVDGRLHGAGAPWGELLSRQLVEPVRFEAGVRELPRGATVVECGAGQVLRGLIGRIRDDVVVRSVAVPEDLAQLDGAVP